MTDSDRPSDVDPPGGPDDADLPADVPDLAAVDPFEASPDDGESLSEFVSREWRESTTARERVRDVMARTTDPLTVAEVANVAAVSEPTARSTLETLVEEGIAIAEERQSGTRYRRNADWYRLQRVRQLAETSRETVESVLRRLDGEIRQYQETYGVDSPDELVVGRDELDESAWQDVSEWRTALVDRQYVKTALQFRQLREAEARTGSGDGVGLDPAGHVSIDR